MGHIFIPKFSIRTPLHPLKVEYLLNESSDLNKISDYYCSVISIRVANYTKHELALQGLTQIKVFCFCILFLIPFFVLYIVPYSL